jgi:response regulator RpfG family c-di-GMP phosphodiesterase
MKKTTARLVKQSETPAGNGAVRGGAPDPDAMRVLLVDDHAAVLRFLAVAFTSRGCVVSTAASAEEALERIADTPYDVVVSDVKMPGLSGLDLLRSVKEQQPGTPVVLITGVPSVDSAVFGLRHQAFDYLVKPFTIEVVHALIDRLREERRHVRETGGGANLAKELARRQYGMEVLSRLGELALQDLDTAVFVEKALGYTLSGLSGDAALILVRDEQGDLTLNHKGDLGLAERLLSLARSSFEQLEQRADADAVSLAGGDQPFAAMTALIPGLGRAMGILCLGRNRRGMFVSDEKELLLGYARTIALALEKMLLGKSLEENLVRTISAFVIALESKDPYLKGHSARVSLYAAEIAKTMALSATEVAVTRRVALLHDLGKLVVMDSILQKPALLTSEECAVMREHPASAARILAPFPFLAQEAEAIKRHHERYDGKGYPDGMKGEQIPLAARIVTVADSFDAMTSNRPYRASLSLPQALEELAQHAWAQFDPAVLESFGRIPLARLTEISRLYHQRSLDGVGSPSVSEALLEACAQTPVPPRLGRGLHLVG